MRFPGFLLGAQPCRPTSRGHLQIRSADPFAAPAIFPNSLATEEDRREMLEGSRFLRRLAAAPSLAAIIAEEMQPGPAVQSDERIGRRHPAARLDACFTPSAPAAWGRIRRTMWSNSRAEGAWPAGLARRRCVDLSGGHVGQHQRADHHGGGEGRRPDTCASRLRAAMTS